MRYSIIVLTYNSAETIGACLEAAIAHLPPDGEVLVVDNASIDETAQIVAPYVSDQVRWIANDRNLGFSAGCNVGIRASKGEFVVLLNPDTVVTAGWLERMAAHFADPTVGAVGPLSDYVAGLQKVQIHVSGADPTSGWEDLAARAGRENAGQAVETQLLIGFCLMVPRRLYDELGMLDEDLFLGNDDLELSWRWHQAGYRLVVAKDVFVHHVGQVSFDTEPKAHVQRLVQESTDALARKLVKHYGAGRVPSPTALWGVPWFEPTPGILEGGQPGRPGASLVVLTWNQLDKTKLCFDSVFANTRDFELVVVDNGSTDGTVAYLHDLAERHPNVKLVLNAANRGFAGGCNQGMAVAAGRDVVLLNNDTVVPEGWLEPLRAIAARPGVGLVGPRSNFVVGPQLVQGIDYDPETLVGYAGFADRWAREHRGQAEATHRVIGFCMYVTREVVERIGGLDPGYGTGNLEDDDYCLRAQVAGFSVVIAHEVIVHHFGHATFKGERLDYTATLERNWRRFCAKWELGDLPIENGYFAGQVIGRGFDPDRDQVPLFAPQGERAQLPGARGWNILLSDDDPDRLIEAVGAYLEAFPEGADVALHVLAGRDAEAVQKRLVQAIEASGRNPEHIPDVALLAAPAVPMELPIYLRAAQLVVGSPAVAEGARDLGLPAFVAPTADQLRSAPEALQGVDLSVPPAPFEVKARERWVVPDARAWRAALEGFLAVAKAGQHALLLVVAPGEAPILQVELMTWLAEHGHDPDTIPDVLVLEATGRDRLGLFKLATHLWPTPDATDALVAAALGLRPAAPERVPTGA